MAGFAGRKAPNVSQYIANLNAIPSAHDVAGQQETFGDLEEELAQFTNTEFLDFDTGSFLEQPAPEYDSGQDEHGKKNGSAHDDVKGLDFVDGAFPFPDLNSFLPTDHPSTTSGPIQNPYATHNPLYNNTTSPVPFNPAPYPGQKHHLSSPTAASAPSSSSTSPPSTHYPSQEPVETAASRLAAEEDKRRRNTAASARFRVKKKQREQALEQTAKELESKALVLEQRIGQLETENEWLRGLVVEKHGGEKEDLRLRWRKGGKGEEDGKDERKAAEEKKEGVGTEEREKE